jgi:hypothetical protein
MPKRWNLTTPIPYVHNGEEKTKWLSLGVMFENKSGTGFNMILDAMPASVDGKFKIMAFEPNDDHKPKSGGFKQTPVEDDEIQF